ncbi:MAG: hypothetical protein ACYTEQ_26370 [Planctomycetota bacterium]|jgi:hypothetical protein
MGEEFKGCGTCTNWVQRLDGYSFICGKCIFPFSGDIPAWIKTVMVHSFTETHMTAHHGCKAWSRRVDKDAPLSFPNFASKEIAKEKAVLSQHK